MSRSRNKALSDHIEQHTKDLTYKQIFGIKNQICNLCIKVYYGTEKELYIDLKKIVE